MAEIVNNIFMGVPSDILLLNSPLLPVYEGSNRDSLLILTLIFFFILGVLEGLINGGLYIWEGLSRP